MTDWRALCEELAHEVEQYAEDRGDLMPECANRARAALAAEPVAEWPTDEELLKLARAELNNSPNWEEPEYDASNPFPYEAPGVAWLNFARAVLARYGHQPAPPAEIDCPACEGVPKPGNQPCAVCGRSALSAEGEVAELAWWLRSLEGASVWFESYSPEALKLARAADLLKQRHPTPVPVSERLPGAEDCDAEGRCWVHQPHEACPESPAWELMLAKYASPNYEAVCWLPATALPLPAGEVEK